MNTMTRKYTHPALSYRNPETGEYDENEEINEEGSISCEYKMITCPSCDGSGIHIFNEVACEHCNGKKVVSSAQLPEWATKLIQEFYQEMAEHKRYSAMEKCTG